MNDPVLGHFEAVAGKSTGVFAGPEDIAVHRFTDERGNSVLITVGLNRYVPDAARIELCVHCRPAEETVFTALLLELAALHITGAQRLYWFHGVALGRMLVQGCLMEAVFLTWPIEPFDLETAALMLDEQRIDIVQAIPITLAELDCLVAKGAEALEERLEAARIDITDVWRPSAC